jgi:Transposase DDE domain
MVPQSAQCSLVVLLWQLVDRLPAVSPSSHRGAGRPREYSDRLFLKALVLMIVKHLYRVHELLQVLEQPTWEMQTLHHLLEENHRYPSRRTFERRLAALPNNLPAQIGCLGRHLVDLLTPWAHCGRAVAMDSTVLHAKDGAVWHKKDKEAGVVPHSRIDTQAGWTKSGWHGWVYGWKLHLTTVVAGFWIPLAAKLTPANTDDGHIAVEMLPEVPDETRYVLGDQHYNREELRAGCECRGIDLVATKLGRYPHKDIGVEVRRLFHKLRSTAMENFNEHFKGIFDLHGAVPTKGKVPTARFILGAVFVYQLVLWQRFEQGLPLNVGLKYYLKAA